jgi:pimeloyl-ACP methyl ester carboxylesterase
MNQVAGAMSGHFSTSDDVRIHYLESGDGDPIVMVPGWSMPAWVWEKQLAGLSDGFRCIALDPRGHGTSEMTDAGQFTERRARDVFELIEHLDLSNVTLIGWSMAISEVLSLTAQFGTARLSALVLVDGVLWTPDEHVRPSFDWSKGFLRDRETWTRGFVAMMGKSAEQPELADKLFAASMAVSPASAYGLLLEYMLSDSRQALAGLEIPVLYAHSPMLAEVAPLAKAALPSIEVVTFDDAGHMLFFDAADRFNDMVRAIHEKADRGR